MLVTCLPDVATWPLAVVVPTASWFAAMTAVAFFTIVLWVVGGSIVVTSLFSVPDLMMMMMMMMAIGILWIVVIVVVPKFCLQPWMPFEGSGGLPEFWDAFDLSALEDLEVAPPVMAAAMLLVALSDLWWTYLATAGRVGCQ